jgi:tetratricopeptide (TPR) repeat protein
MPTYEEALSDAQKFYDEKKADLSLEICDHLLGHTLKDPRVHILLGALHMNAKRYGHAIQAFRSAAAISPDQANCWDGLGCALRVVGQEEAARECYRKAIELDPSGPRYAHLGGTYVNAGDPQTGIEILQKAVELSPTDKTALNNLALVQLEAGDWKNGFDTYRHRKGHHNWTKRDFGALPEWDGKPTRRLAIHGEQGVGDEVMFLTCFEDAIRVCPDVVVEVNPRLVSLMKASLGVPCVGSVQELIALEPSAYIAMGDLPYFFRRNGNFPDGVYLKPQEVYPRGSKPRIGISWLGGSRDTHSYHRNFPIEWWRYLLEYDAEWVSLQYGGHGKKEADVLGLPHNQEWIDDLHKFAALVKSCDLVISVCNTTVHFAGALGVPCWVFTPFAPAWRYGVKGEMPWYESVRLFRQEKGEDWRKVVTRMRWALDDHRLSR